jgi:hypothetical protein
MRCPCCRQTLFGSAPECPHCQFSFASAGPFFGEIPRLQFPLTDLAGVLSSWNKRKVRRSLLEMAAVFPQVKFAAVLLNADARVRLGAQAFWLFNSGTLVPAQESGDLCRLVLLVLDASRPRAACMIGYGLEPFVPPEAIDRIAAAAANELRNGSPAAAILKALEGARFEFARVWQAMPRGLQQGQPEPSTLVDETEVFVY